MWHIGYNITSTSNSYLVRSQNKSNTVRTRESEKAQFFSIKECHASAFSESNDCRRLTIIGGLQHGTNDIRVSSQTL